MNIFIYSDESGVFDKIHNEYFVFGGLILLGKDSKEEWERLYRNAEIAITPKYQQNQELKASVVSNTFWKTKHSDIITGNNILD